MPYITSITLTIQDVESILNAESELDAHLIFADALMKDRVSWNAFLSRGLRFAYQPQLRARLRAKILADAKSFNRVRIRVYTERHIKRLNKHARYCIDLR